MVFLSSAMVLPKRVRQSSRARSSSLPRFGRLCRRPLQLEEDNLTSYMVWFTIERIICGTDFVVRSGNEVRVETHRSG